MTMFFTSLNDISKLFYKNSFLISSTTNVIALSISIVPVTITSSPITIFVFLNIIAGKISPSVFSNFILVKFLKVDIFKTINESIVYVGYLLWFPCGLFLSIS